MKLEFAESKKSGQRAKRSVLAMVLLLDGDSHMRGAEKIGPSW